MKTALIGTERFGMIEQKAIDRMLVVQLMKDLRDRRADDDLPNLQAKAESGIDGHGRCRHQVVLGALRVPESREDAAFGAHPRLSVHGGGPHPGMPERVWICAGRAGDEYPVELHIMRESHQDPQRPTDFMAKPDCGPHGATAGSALI